MLIVTYARERYCLTRALATASEYQVLRSCRLLEAWMLREDMEARLGIPNELELSRWVKWLELLYAPRTAAKIRGDVLGVLNDAADAGLRPPIRPRRVRAVRVPPPMPRTSSVETIQRFIVDGCRRLDGNMKNGVRRAHFLEAIYRCAWRTGLRRGDLHRLNLASISEDGRVWVTQGKTRRPTLGRLGSEEIAMLRAIGSDTPLAFPHAPRTFYAWSREAMELAGLSIAHLPKFLQQFRVSAFNDVAKRHGRHAASKFIGHAGPGADCFYADELFLTDGTPETTAICSPEPTLPPPLP